MSECALWSRPHSASRWPTPLLLVLAGTLLAAPVAAAIPTQIAVQGQLLNAAGAAVPDGSYLLTFRLYPSAAAQQATWSEVVDKLQTSGGRFEHALGSATPLSAQLLGQLPTAWLGVQVANEPEGKRVALRGAPAALRAAVAESLICTGCASLAALKPDGNLNLGGHSVSAGAVASGTILASQVQAQSLSGDGSKLSGATPTPTACKTGQIATGVDGAGQLICGDGGAGGGDDQLGKVSGGLLSTKIGGAVQSKTTPKDIDDNSPIGTVDEITVGDLGIASQFSVSVHLKNSDLKTVEVLLYGPDNSIYVLHQKQPGTELKETWPITAKTVSGDLSAWLGKNPKGIWRLRVIDLGPSNGAKDGQILSWSVNMLAKSLKQVTSTGQFAAAGGFSLQTSAGPPFACAAQTMGAHYWDSKDKHAYYCDGSWRRILVESLCGNKVINSTENCDDGNTDDGDGCTHLCLKNVCGDGIYWPAKEQCDDGNKDDNDACANNCVANFSTVTFTTCAQTGRLGPSQGQCDTAYAGNNWLKGKVKLVAGVQNWTVPFTGSYTIEAYGGQGGFNGAKGARMKGSFNLKANQVLEIVVGQMGIRGSSGGGGGGGGSFVYSKDTLHIAAGGGGGHAQSGAVVGFAGTTALNGTPGSGGTKGGVNGGAGGDGSSDGSTPGAGWKASDLTNYGSNSVGAKSRPTWLGAESKRHNYKCHGGFGGGGGSIHPGGGGGGYSGGGAGKSGSSNGGGGGGSFNAGAKQSNSSGVNSGHGKVIISSP